MSTTSVPLYDLTLTQLAPDAKKAGIEYGTIERPGTPEKAMRTLLKDAAALAPGVAYPLSPEIRIVAPTGRFVVQLKEGRLHFVSWASAKSRGGNPSLEQIIGIVSGEIAEGDSGCEAAPVATPRAENSASRKRVILAVLLVLLIVGANGFTFWNAKRPPGNFLPPYRLLEPEPAARILSDVAGNYETGREAGDRRLQIARDGGVLWIKFGVNQTPKQKKEVTARAVQSGGAPALLTSTNGLIKIKDASSVVYFGDTYVRVLK